MRTWGRITNQDGSRTWVQVNTTAEGSDDFVWLTTLAQTLLLNLGESPFFANYGIPAHPAVVQQVVPDYYVTFTQQLFAPRFASLIVAKLATPDPVYNINIVTTQGTKLNATIPIPT